MSDIQLYIKLRYLTPDLKSEVYDFIDFLINKKRIAKPKKKPQFGCARGRFKMTADFDEPLDDFKEYMV